MFPGNLRTIDSEITWFTCKLESTIEVLGEKKFAISVKRTLTKICLGMESSISLDIAFILLLLLLLLLLIC